MLFCWGKQPDANHKIIRNNIQKKIRGKNTARFNLLQHYSLLMPAYCTSFLHLHPGFHNIHISNDNSVIFFLSQLFLFEDISSTPSITTFSFGFFFNATWGILNMPSLKNTALGLFSPAVYSPLAMKFTFFLLSCFYPHNLGPFFSRPFFPIGWSPVQSKFPHSTFPIP